VGRHIVFKRWDKLEAEDAPESDYIMLPNGYMRTSIFWLAGALLIAAIALCINLSDMRGPLLRAPGTPLDLVSPSKASLWRLLWMCEPKIPDKGTYTVRAMNPGEEMYLYMMSLGVLVHRSALPSSYYGKDLKAIGKRAQYIIVAETQAPPEPGARLIASGSDGCLYLRTRP